MFTSVLLVTRGRKKLLKECIERMNTYAKYPKELEILIGIDDDDIETIEFIKSKELPNEYKNIRVFIFPRMGYHLMGLYLKELFGFSTGDIIVPISERFFVFKKNWDEAFLKHKNKPAVLHNSVRLAVTRKGSQEYDLIKDFLTKIHIKKGVCLADAYLKRTAKKMGISIRVDKWCGKADVSEYYDQEHPRWELKDKNILKNLDNIHCKELKI
jgi:hypothetical protein